MKTPVEKTVSTAKRPKIAALDLQVTEARRSLATAKTRAQKAKTELKRVRKAYKQTKREAKEARKTLKALRRALNEATLAVISPLNPPFKKAGVESSAKPAESKSKVAPTSRPKRRAAKKPKATVPVEATPAPTGESVRAAAEAVPSERPAEAPLPGAGTAAGA